MKSSYKIRTGHERLKNVKKNNNLPSCLKRRRALVRLEKQLLDGTKTTKLITEPLQEKDVIRIKKEIAILLGRI